MGLMDFLGLRKRKKQMEEQKKKEEKKTIDKLTLIDQDVKIEEEMIAQGNFSGLLDKILAGELPNNYPRYNLMTRTDLVHKFKSEACDHLSKLTKSVSEVAYSFDSKPISQNLEVINRLSYALHHLPVEQNEEQIEKEIMTNFPNLILSTYDIKTAGYINKACEVLQDAITKGLQDETAKIDLNALPREAFRSPMSIINYANRIYGNHAFEIIKDYLVQQTEKEDYIPMYCTMIQMYGVQKAITAIPEKLFGDSRIVDHIVYHDKSGKVVKELSKEIPEFREQLTAKENYKKEQELKKVKEEKEFKALMDFINGKSKDFTTEGFTNCSSVRMAAGELTHKHKHRLSQQQYEKLDFMHKTSKMIDEQIVNKGVSYKDIPARVLADDRYQEDILTAIEFAVAKEYEKNVVPELRSKEEFRKLVADAQQIFLDYKNNEAKLIVEAEKEAFRKDLLEGFHNSHIKL